MFGRIHVCPNQITRSRVYRIHRFLILRSFRRREADVQGGDVRLSNREASVLAAQSGLGVSVDVRSNVREKPVIYQTNELLHGTVEENRMINTILWIGTTALASWLLLTIGFFAITLARERRDAGIEFGWVVRYPLYLMLAIGAIADVVFNVLIGSVIFREVPKEWFFTQRIKRLVESSDKEQYEVASKWKERINKIQPGHI